MKFKDFIKNNLFSFTISTIFMAALCIVAFVFNTRAGIVSAVLFVCYIAYVIIYAYFGSGNVKNALAGKSLASHTFDFITNMDVPVLLCDSNGMITWYNSALRELYGDTPIKTGESIKSLGNGEIDAVRFLELEENGEKYFTYKTNDNKFYRVRPNKVQTMNKSFYLVVWSDSTELEELSAEHINSNVLVAYAVVDNIADISQGVQDKYRGISAEISKVLNAWVASMNGIIKEYERDKYIIFIEERYIQAQIESKFDVLDRVLELSSSEDTIPVTISIGMSRINGSLTDKEEAAKISLQLALQRGGAQAVVKTKDDNEVFGGKTKTLQKRTKIKARVVADQLMALINKSSNVLIMAHSNPDFDAIASSVGIARLSMYCKKPVKMITDLTNPGFEICALRLSPISDYDEMFVDKVYGQDLLTPTTLLVICDVSNERIFESSEMYRKADRIAIIDHHRQIQEFDRNHDIVYIEPTASSASELVSEMLEMLLPPNTLNKEEADLLLAGILLDTQNFVRNVGIRTFSAAMYLRSEGANTMKAQSMFKYKLGEFRKLAEFEKNIFIFRKIFAITQYDIDNTPENRITAAQASDRMLMIEGVKASFTLSNVDDSICISARSDGSVNVSLILEKLKGGGHFDSAGAKLNNITMKQAMNMLRDAIVEYCDTQR